MKKKVAHYKWTNCAWAADEIVKCINKYSENYEAILIHNKNAASYMDIPQYVYDTEDEAIKIINEQQFDFIHFHNKYVKVNIPQVIQYHSPPWYPPEHWTDLSFPGKKLVVGQYHATLKEFSHCIPVPNVIDIFDDLYMQLSNKDDIIRIGFSPSVKTKDAQGCVESKGYDKTIFILDKIKEANKNVEIDIIHGVDIKECIERKSQCDILIDECVTKSYHRSGLEGLALGKLTICSLEQDVIDVVKKMMNCEIIPFQNIWIQDLEKEIQNIINEGKDYLHHIGMRNRKWMEQYWNPKDIVKRFEIIYEEIINDK